MHEHNSKNQHKNCHHEKSEQPLNKKSDIYSCPMHPEIQQDKPGMCPECGMNLVPIKEKDIKTKVKTGNKHQGHSTNIFKIKFWVSLILSIPVVFYSEVAQELASYQAPTFYGSEYLSFVLASIIFFYGGWIFLASAYRELKSKVPGMMTLIALAISVAYIYSVALTLLRQNGTLYWELATLITVMLLGHWLEMRAVSGAKGALKELSKLLPDNAEVIKDGQTKIISLSELKKGDIVLVKPGGRVPADGIIVEGASEVNESIATGESKPVNKQKGNEVIAGTTNGDGSLKVEVTKIGEETFLAGVMRLVAEAQASKSRLQILSDKAAFYLTIIAIVTGTITLLTWMAFGDTSFAVNRMVAVLVITCPHALGLAIPLVASISTTKAANNGFLVKQRLALESARNIDIVLFDKTGTLTKGEFGVEKVIAAKPFTSLDVLRFVGSLNVHSEHSLARATVKEAKEKNTNFAKVDNFKRIPGKGVSGEIENKKVLVGSQQLFQEEGIVVPDELMKEIEIVGKQGKNIIYAAINKEFLGGIFLADVIREESRQAVDNLKEMDIKVGMITGDSEEVASWVASELKIDEYFAKVLPEQKSEKVKLLQKQGLKVAMVGDGVNDAPALTQADLGIAIGAGTNVAIESAGIILIKNNPQDIPKIIRLSRLTYKKMIQNLFWATGYNVVAIPLAAGVLVFKGIVLQPAVAAVFMSVSTVIVAFNALLLRNKKI